MLKMEPTPIEKQPKPHHIPNFLPFMLLLFIASVIIPIRLGMNHLSVTGIISIALDWMSQVVLMIVYDKCRNGRTLENSREFRALIIVLYLCVFFELGTWIFDSLAPYRVLSYISNIGANSAILLGTFFYYVYLRASRDINAGVYPLLYPILFAVAVIGIIAELLNIFFGYFYVIDPSGTYIRGAYGSILGYLPFIVILAGSLLFLLRQKLDIRTKIIYMSYCILPFLCSVWYTLTGYPPTFYVSVTMTVLIIYGNIYVEQCNQAEFYELQNAKSEAEAALNRNMLMLSQIKPHFLYNALSSIEVLCSIDPKKAANAIHHFSMYLRSNMDIIKSNETIPFDRELEHIRNYIWLENMRFEDELVYKEDIEVTNFRVPQLSIQPIIENAVKHGMMGNADGILHVSLQTWESNHEYVICITDDGAGFDPTQALPNDGRSHLGINSAEYALRLRVNGTMHIDSHIGEGTTVTIRIPKSEGRTNA